MTTTPIDGVLHYVTNDPAQAGTTYGAQAGARTGRFSCIMAIPAHHDRVALINAQVPRTYYVVDASNCSFTVRASGISFSFDCSAGTGIGNYDANTWLLALNNADNWDVVPGVWTLGTYTRKYRLQTSPTVYPFTSANDGIVITGRMARVMGFESSTTPYITEEEKKIGALVAPYPVNFTVTNVIHVCSDLSQEDTLTPFRSDTLGRLYTNDVPYGGYSILEARNPYEQSRRLTTRVGASTYRHGESGFVSIEFRLLDDSGQLLLMQGGRVALGLYTYSKASLHDLLRSFALMVVNLAQEQRLVATATLGAAERSQRRLRDQQIEQLRRELDEMDADA